MKKLSVFLFVLVFLAILSVAVSAYGINKTVVVYGVDSVVYGSHVNLKIYTENGESVFKTEKFTLNGNEHIVSELSKESLDVLLKNINGVYKTYVENSLIEFKQYYKLSDFTNIDDGKLKINSDNQITGIESKTGSIGENTIRMCPNTKIYIMDSDGSIRKLSFTAGRSWCIEGIKDDALFYADKVGFGSSAKEYDNRPGHGEASILVIKNDGNTHLNIYTLEVIYVEDDLSDCMIGKAQDFDLENSDPDDVYTRFLFYEEVYSLEDYRIYHSALYVPGELNILEKGIYLTDEDGIIYDSIKFPDLKIGANELCVNGNLKTYVYLKEIGASDIDLYNNRYVQVNGVTCQANRLRTVIFRFYEDNGYGTINAVNKGNGDLLKYLNKIGDKVPALFVPNDGLIMNQRNLFIANTLRCVVLGTIRDGKFLYEVNYDGNGGTGVPAGCMTNGEYTVPLTVPTRSGYNFLGWSLKKDGKVDYLRGSKITVNDNITLYAVWQKIKVKKGDADNSGTVNATDVAYLYRCVSGWSGYTLTDTGKLNSDTNGDGIINLIDAIYLERHLAGWHKYIDFTA